MPILFVLALPFLTFFSAGVISAKNEKKQEEKQLIEFVAKLSEKEKAEFYESYVAKQSPEFQARYNTLTTPAPIEVAKTKAK